MTNVSGDTLLYFLLEKPFQTPRGVLKETTTPLKLLGQANVIYAPPLIDLSSKANVTQAIVSLFVINTPTTAAGEPTPGAMVLDSIITESRGSGCLLQIRIRL